MTDNTQKPEKFINREDELKSLDELYKKTTEEAQFLILYGK